MVPRPPANELPSCRTPFGLTIRRLAIPSGSVAYIDEGEGPPVVLIHGGPLTSLGFVRVIRALRRHHRVIAPDLPGFGQSRPSNTFTSSLCAYAESVDEFCAALKLERLVLFGCDAGACIGLFAAARNASRIAGLVVADTVPLPLTGRAWLVKIMLKYVVSSRWVRFLNRRFNLLPWLVATVDSLHNPLSAEDRAILTGEYDSGAKRDRILDVFAAMGRDEHFMREAAAGVTRHLADKPALLLFGQFDPVRFVGGVSRFRQMLPRSTVAIIPGERHFPILGAGEEVGETMTRWMRSIAYSAESTS